MKTPNSVRIAASVALPGLHRRLVEDRYESSGHFVRASKKVAVEGFPRSGNTWLVGCLVAAGIPEEKIASHLHYAWHARLAADLGVPVLCPVRNPADAVASLCVRDPSMGPSLALRYYKSFHLKMLRIPGVHFIPFEELVGPDASGSVSRLMSAAGINVAADISEDVVRAVVREMARNEQRPTSDVVRRVGLPHAERDEEREKAMKRVRNARRELGRAVDIYHRILGAARQEGRS